MKDEQPDYAQPQALWQAGWGELLGISDVHKYWADIPPKPHVELCDGESILLVDPRVDVERACEHMKLSVLSLHDCAHDQTSDGPYWIRARLIANPSGRLIRETIPDEQGNQRGCTLIEGLMLRILVPDKLKGLPLLLPGSRFYGPPDDHYFRCMIRPNGVVSSVCTDTRMEALIAVCC